MSGDVSGAQLAGKRKGVGGFPYSFLKIEKNCPNNLEKFFDCVNS